MCNQYFSSLSATPREKMSRLTFEYVVQFGSFQRQWRHDWRVYMVRLFGGFSDCMDDVMRMASREPSFAQQLRLESIRHFLRQPQRQTDRRTKTATSRRRIARRIVSSVIAGCIALRIRLLQTSPFPDISHYKCTMVEQKSPWYKH